MERDHLLIHPSPSLWSFRTVKRIGFIFLFSLIPLSGHFLKATLPALQEFFLQDPALHLSYTHYSLLLSSITFPNFILPYFSGFSLDYYGKSIIAMFLAIILVGHTVFIIGIMNASFRIAMLGEIIFGFAEGSVIVATRTLVSYWYTSYELTFAIGTMMAVSNGGKMVAKIALPAIAVYYDNYITALWYEEIVGAISLIVGSIVCYITHMKKTSGESDEENQQLVNKDYHQSTSLSPITTIQTPVNRQIEATYCDTPPTPRSGYAWYQLPKFPLLFWILVILHVTFLNVFHLFHNIASSFFYQTCHYSFIRSGVISALGHVLFFFAPIIGVVIDKMGGQLTWILTSSLLTLSAYVCLLVSPCTTSMYSMIILSFGVSFCPMLLMASIPATIPHSVYGTAFGIVEIIDALGGTLGNLTIGYIREVTGSYTGDIYFLLALAIVTVILTNILIYERRKCDINLFHKNVCPGVTIHLKPCKR